MKRLVTLGLVLVLASLPVAAGATGPGAAGPTGSPQKLIPPPPDIARIRDAVNREPVLKIENGQLRIYVEVIGKWPSFAEISKDFDLMHGSSKGGSSISHQDLFGTTAPKNLYGSGGIQAGELLTMAIVNYVGQTAILKGLKAIGKARSEKEIRDIRAQIDRELAAIKGGK